MPNDAFTISAITNELKSTLCGGKINKIMQPETDEIVLLIYSGGKLLHLLFSACANYPRIHLTSSAKENPAAAYQFCMTLRKYLTGGVIISIETAQYDRIITINIENSTELKDKTIKKLIIEIMGRQSNIILCEEDNKIISPLKTISLDLTAKRNIIAGLKYVYPENTKIKINDTQGVKMRLGEFDGGDLAGFITGSFMGFSKTTAEYIIYRARAGNNRLNENEILKLIAAFDEFDKKITEGIYNPCILLNNKAPIDFFVFPYFDNGNYCFYKSLNECVDAFYSLKDKGKRLTEKKKNLLSVLKNAIAKSEKKIALLNDKLIECENMEYYRECGELLTAYIYMIKGKEKSITVSNYFDEKGKDITITLNENLSPSKNAQQYFKKYNKLKNAKQASLEQKNEAIEQLDYLLSVEEFLSPSENITDIEEIAAELAKSGIVRQNISTVTSKKKNKEPNIFIKAFDGYTLYCGKNNIQNDYVTFKIAKPGDLWFHVKNIHGCHLVLSSPDKRYSDEAILVAAKCTAEFSCKNNTDKVSVDYTFKKFVKKPSGTKPGFVIYTDYKSILVNSEDIT